MASFSSFATDIYNNQHLYRNQGKFCGLMLYHAGSNFFYHEDLNESEIDYAKKLLNGSKDLTPNIREFRNEFDYDSARSFFDEILEDEDAMASISNVFLSTTDGISKEALIISLTEMLKEYMTYDFEFSYTSVESHYHGVMSTADFIPSVPKTDDFALIIESNFKCPISRKNLIKNGLSNYVIVRIFPSGLDSSTETLFKAISRKPVNLDANSNLIPLATSVAYGYLDNPTLEMFTKLLDAKAKNKAGRELEERLESYDLEENITKLLDALTSIKFSDSLEPLSMDALKISDKIPETMIGTYSIVESLALKFYNFINTHLSTLEKELIVDEDTIDGKSTKLGKSIKAISKEYSQSGTPIPEHIEKLAHKILEKTGYPEDMIDIARIVVAYFIQHCEVLSDEIAE